MFLINKINPVVDDYILQQQFTFPVYSQEIKEDWERILNCKINPESESVTISRECYILNLQEIYKVYFAKKGELS